MTPFLKRYRDVGRCRRLSTALEKHGQGVACRSWHCSRQQVFLRWVVRAQNELGVEASGKPGAVQFHPTCRSAVNGDVERRERIGGLPNVYYREAAWAVGRLSAPYGFMYTVRVGKGISMSFSISVL